MSNSPRLLVTGANGFLGSRVVSACCDEGWRVRIFVRSSSCLDRLEGLPFERVCGDIRDAEALVKAARDCDGILHLASLSRWDLLDTPEVDSVVVDGMRAVLDAAQRAGGLRTVFVSSATALGGAESPQVRTESELRPLDAPGLRYGRAKRAAEALASESGLPVVVVNPAEIYGPQDDTLVTAGNLLDWLGSGPALVCPGGTSVAHVDDVAAAVVAAWKSGRVGERYFLGGENLRLAELACLTLELGGCPQKSVWTLPRGLTRTSARLAGKLRLPYPVPPAVIPYATRFWFFSAAKAEAELGVSFRSAEATLRSTIDWLVSSGRLHRRGNASS